MDFNTPFFSPFNFFRPNTFEKTYKSLEDALNLIKEAVDKEYDDELFHNYMISSALTTEEKDIITSIRDDKKKHNKFFREIYAFYTGRIIPLSTGLTSWKPECYETGITRAKLEVFKVVEIYRNIRAGIPSNYYRDMVLEILTDAQNHAYKYEHILYLNLKSKFPNADSNLETKGPERKADTYWLTPSGYYRQTREFTLDELAKYDGSSGMPAYVAINGIVYDVSNEAAWGGGTHFGLTAGKDLTAQFQGCHNVTSILGKLPTIGILKV